MTVRQLAFELKSCWWLSKSDRAVFLFLWGHQPRRRRPWPTYEEIARGAEVGRSAVGDSLPRLKRFRMIEWHRGAFGDQNLYEVMPPARWSRFVQAAVPDPLDGLAPWRLVHAPPASPSSAYRTMERTIPEGPLTGR